jgi:hypothetical protein
MSLNAPDRSARQAHARDALSLAPSTAAMHLLEERPDLDAATCRDRLDLLDLTNNFEGHWRDSLHAVRMAMLANTVPLTRQRRLPSVESAVRAPTTRGCRLLGRESESIDAHRNSDQYQDHESARVNDHHVVRIVDRLTTLKSYAPIPS